jgi:hypothetical protein
MIGLKSLKVNDQAVCLLIAQKRPIRVAYKLRKFWNEPSAGLFRTGADAENTS